MVLVRNSEKTAPVDRHLKKARDQTAERGDNSSKDEDISRKGNNVNKR